jgi:hypothetical protein
MIHIVEKMLTAGDTEIDVSEANPVLSIKSVMVFWDQDGEETNRHIRPVGEDPLQEGDPNYFYDEPNTRVLLTGPFSYDIKIKAYVRQAE